MSSFQRACVGLLLATSYLRSAYGLQVGGSAEAVTSIDAAATRKQTKTRANPEATLLFIGVYTSPTTEGRDRRQEIRDSYWNHRELRRNGLVEAKFVVGRPRNDDVGAKALKQELKDMPDDFVQIDMLEGYHNLTQKTIDIMNWFALHSKAKFMLKMDDDTYPHIDTIIDYLQEETVEYLHMGLMFPCAPVLKMTKWAEDLRIWNHTFFPKYMQGSGYFLSAPLVKSIALEHYDLNVNRMLNNEDASVGLWTEMERWADPNIEIEQRNIAATLTGCTHDDLLSMNNQLGYMNCYWKRELRGEEDICCHGSLNKTNVTKPQSLLQVGARQRSKTQAASRSRAVSRERAGVGCYSE